LTNPNNVWSHCIPPDTSAGQDPNVSSAPEVHDEI
jgi:hypothetical protein